MGGVETPAGLTIEPGPEGAQFGYIRDLPGGEDPFIAHQRQTAGPQGLQHVLGLVEEGPFPGPLGGDGPDHALPQEAHGQFRLGLGEALEGGDAGGDGLGQEGADDADRVLHQAGAVVVAEDQAPQPAIDHQGGAQGRPHPHVAQVLDVNGGHAAQAAQGHVQGG